MSPEGEEIIGSLIAWRDRPGVPASLAKLLDQLAAEVAAGGLDYLSDVDEYEAALAGDGEDDAGAWADPVV